MRIIPEAGRRPRRGQVGYPTLLMSRFLRRREQQMADTPIIDAAAKAIMECDEESAWDSIASADCRKAAIAALRAVLPWDLPVERLEAMVRAAFRIGAELPQGYVRAITAAYRADPIMRELYPERFDG